MDGDTLIFYLLLGAVVFVIVLFSLAGVDAWKSVMDYEERIAVGLPLSPAQLREGRRRHTANELSRIASERDMSSFNILRQYTLYAPPEEAYRALLLLDTLADKYLFGSNPAHPQEEVAYLDSFMRLRCLMDGPSLVMRLLRLSDAPQSAVLLRPIVDATIPDTLLRPAGGGSKTEDSLLVRPAVPGE